MIGDTNVVCAAEQTAAAIALILTMGLETRLRGVQYPAIRLAAEIRPQTTFRRPTDHHNRETEQHKGAFMLYTIAVVLLILWVLGLVTSYTLGGFIHILLVVAIVMVLINLISGRRSL